MKLYVMREEFEQSLNPESEREMHADFSVLSRGIKRKTDFLKDSCAFLDNEE